MAFRGFGGGVNHIRVFDDFRAPYPLMYPATELLLTNSI